MTPGKARFINKLTHMTAISTSRKGTTRHTRRRCGTYAASYERYSQHPPFFVSRASSILAPSDGGSGSLMRAGQSAPALINPPTPPCTQHPIPVPDEKVVKIPTFLEKKIFLTVLGQFTPVGVSDCVGSACSTPVGLACSTPVRQV